MEVPQKLDSLYWKILINIDDLGVPPILGNFHLGFKQRWHYPRIKLKSPFLVDYNVRPPR